MLTRLAIPLLLVPMLACSGSENETSSPAAPSPAASARTTFTLSGQVIQKHESSHFRSDRDCYQR